MLRRHENGRNLKSQLLILSHPQINEAKARGLQAPHRGTQTEPTRVKKKSPMVQLHMAKAQTNEIHVILFFRKDGMRLTG
jgi:hypothetical protein